MTTLYAPPAGLPGYALRRNEDGEVQVLHLETLVEGTPLTVGEVVAGCSRDGTRVRFRAASVYTSTGDRDDSSIREVKDYDTMMEAVDYVRERHSNYLRIQGDRVVSGNRARGAMESYLRECSEIAAPDAAA